MFGDLTVDAYCVLADVGITVYSSNYVYDVCTVYAYDSLSSYRMLSAVRIFVSKCSVYTRIGGYRHGVCCRIS